MVGNDVAILKNDEILFLLVAVEARVSVRGEESFPG